MEQLSMVSHETWWWLKNQIEDPDNIALLDGESGVGTTKAKLQEKILGIANYLAKNGVQRNDRLAILMESSSSMAITIMGSMTAAAIAPLNPTRPITVIEEDCKRLKINKIITEDCQLHEINKIAKNLSLPVLAVNPQEIEPAYSPLPDIPQPDDLALLLQTSGTTGSPKVVPLTHGNILSSAETVAKVLELTNSDRSMAIMPLYFIQGLVASLLTPLQFGGSVVCCHKLAPADQLNTLRSMKPTWLTTVPTLMHAWIAEIEEDQKSPKHNLRFIRTAGLALSPILLEKLESTFNVPVLESYGCSEAYSISSNSINSENTGRKKGSVGQPTGCIIQIIDDGGHSLGVGESGKIAVQGKCVTCGYEESERSGWITIKDKSRWFITGDEGYIDEEGFLYITGRTKEMINRGGIKIIPRRIDEALLRHPCVEQAVAFAVQHSTLGEDVNAAVILKRDADTNEEELRQFSSIHLDDNEVPSQILIVDEIPKGSTGKPRRIGLAEQLNARNKYEENFNDEIEQLVANTISEVLRCGEIKASTNFYAIGGDSLSSARVMHRISQIVGISLSPTLIFQAPTPRLLGTKINGLINQAILELENSSIQVSSSGAI